VGSEMCIRDSYYDADGDGYGDPTDAVDACDAPADGWVLTGGDCDDAESMLHDVCSGELAPGSTLALEDGNLTAYEGTATYDSENGILTVILADGTAVRINMSSGGSTFAIYEGTEIVAEIPSGIDTDLTAGITEWAYEKSGILPPSEGKGGDTTRYLTAPEAGAMLFWTLDEGVIDVNACGTNTSITCPTNGSGVACGDGDTGLPDDTDSPDDTNSDDTGDTSLPDDTNDTTGSQDSDSEVTGDDTDGEDDSRLPIDSKADKDTGTNEPQVCGCTGINQGPTSAGLTILGALIAFVSRRKKNA